MERLKEYIKFFRLALPFAIVNGVVWGIGIVTLPLIAKTSSRSGMTFAMINLGIAIGAIVWSKMSHVIKLRNLIFASSFFSFISWLAIVILNGVFLVSLAFVFGFFSAGIFALSSVVVTNNYPKNEWDRYISLMQGFMTFGTVVGLLITSIFSTAVVGIPFLAVAFLSYLPFLKEHHYIVEHHELHLKLLKPKMHFSEIFTGYFYKRFRLKHFLHLGDEKILLLNAGWIIGLLAAAPIYAVYPLLMRHVFDVSTSLSSFIYAISTIAGVFFFIEAGKISEKSSPIVPFDIGLLMYLLSFALMFISIKTGIHIIGVFGFIVMINAWSFISVGMNVGIVAFADESKRAELLGVANTFQSLDNMVGGFLGGAIAYHFGYSTVVTLSLLLALISTIVGAYLFLKHKNR